MRLVYVLLTYLLAPVVIAMEAWKALTSPEYRGRLGQRLGFRVPQPPADCLWVHGVSVGEVQAAAALRICTLEISSRIPIGWGPYIINEWTPGQSIHLVKNLNYFLASGGLPKFDELTFLFEPDVNAAVSELINGACDVLDPSVGLGAGGPAAADGA